MKGFRQESDSLGMMHIPEDKLWGAVTARTCNNFKINGMAEQMPIAIIHALALIKKSAARANQKLSLLDSKKARAIVQAAEEVRQGKWDTHFPLPVWQTGSGTGSNMNVNEVIANRAIQISGGKMGDKSIHPNDDVNKCQSSNDVFPTAMHIAAVDGTIRHLLPALQKLESSLKEKEKQFASIVKVGRTHLMDAVPLTLGQEFSGYVKQLQMGRERLKASLLPLHTLPLGGTAVGTGLNAAKGFKQLAIEWIAKESGYPFQPADNLFALSSAHDGMVALSGVLKTLACGLMKLAGDIRLLASGPRAGLNELILPVGEPGSSIMPGKVNPTQSEALTMICAEVIGCDNAVAIGGASGHLELNVFKPLIIFNILRSINLLAGSCRNFNKYCIQGLKANTPAAETLPFPLFDAGNCTQSTYRIR